MFFISYELVYEWGYSPIPNDLSLGCMRPEELDVGIFVIEERDDKTPCFVSFLNLEEILL